MMNNKTLVTHVRPHLDDVCAIWMYQKYVPGWKKSRVEFMPTTSEGGKPYGGQPVDSDANIVHIGIGRGKLDEHKGNIGKSATTLLFAELKKHGHLPKNLVKRKALKLVTDYVLEDDLGKRIGHSSWPFEMATLLMWMPKSEDRVSTGITMLEALLYFYEDYVKLEKDWRKKKVFKTKWGRGVGVVSAMRATIRAYSEGYKLVAQVDPKHGYRSIRAHADSGVDLTSAYRRVKALEPKADWYLHHSKKMLICGSDVAPESERSKLTLPQLMALVRD